MLNRNHLSALLIFLILFNYDLSLGTDFYRWTDEDGVTNITNQPQDSTILNKKDLKVLNLPGSTPEKATVPSDQQANAKEGQYVVPFENLNGAILVDVILNNNIPAKMQLDTGANLTAINVNLWKKLNQPSPSRPIKGKVTTAGGIVDANGIVIENIRLGEAVKKNVRAVYSDEKYDLVHCDGLLGMSFLSDFKFTIDYDNNIIILHKR